MGKIVTAILAVSLVALVAVAMLLFPGRVSDISFWLKVGWLAFLLTLNWAVSSGVFLLSRNDSSSVVIAILPAAHLVVYFYSLASAGLLIFASLPATEEFLGRWHLAAQVIITAITVVLVLFMSLASAGASVDPQPVGIPRIEDVAANFKKAHDLIIANDPASAKRLRGIYETLTYAVPRPISPDKFASYEAINRTSLELLSAISGGRTDYGGLIDQGAIRIVHLK